MLPSVPLVLTSTKDGSKVSAPDDDGIKVKCEPTTKNQVSTIAPVKTTGNKHVQSKIASQTNVGHLDKIEERHSEKLLRPIAPKPVTIVCMPDIPNVKETEIEVAEKLDIVPKNCDEISIKTVGVGSTTKCEKENEEETSVLKKNNTTGRSPPKSAKKKPKQIRDLEKTLNCLLSDNEQVKDEKAFAFAQSYFLKVTETLHGRDDATYSEFMKTMNDFGVTIFDATELYRKVTKIFEKYPCLSEEFLAFLLPEQAMQCGKFMQYIMITKMRSFCRKLELFYSKQPCQLRKIYSSLSTLASNNKASLDDLKNTILPLLRNNSLLVNMFLELMPTEAPHASSLTDYESMDFGNVDIQNPKPEDWFETVEVPPPVEDNMYGGEDCICPCHIPPEGKSRRCSTHCISCGTKFIQGRVYIHSGSMLRPARVSFKELKTKAIERLCVKDLKTRRKIDKNQSQSLSSKKNNSTRGEISTNVSNKISSPKTTKKATKGKSVNENQKKSNKTLSPPKVSHNKQLGNDKNISKPPRKRIKLLTNNPEISSPPSSGKSPLISSKKSIAQAGKQTCKIEAKVSSKDASQPPTHQTETTRRTARSHTRNMTLTNDGNQKPNRKHTGNTVKENFNSSTSELITKKCKEEMPLKNKTVVSLSFDGVSVKEGCKISSEKAETGVESPLVENVCTSIFTIKNVNDQNNSEDSNLCNQNIKSPGLSSVNLSKNEKKVSEQSLATDEQEAKIDMFSCTSPLATTLEKGDENIELGNSIENLDSEDQQRISGAPDSDKNCESSMHCPYISSDESSSDQLLDITIPESASETFSQCEGNMLQSEGDDVKIEMELENSFENVSSEDEKNILDSEDFPFNSSSDSDIEDNFNMDIEETYEKTEGCSNSAQNDVNIEIDPGKNEGHSGDATIERPVSTPWTRDEDKIILRTFQSVNNSDSVFKKICNELPSRTAEEVQCRFQTLMSFLQKMAVD